MVDRKNKEKKSKGQKVTCHKSYEKNRGLKSEVRRTKKQKTEGRSQKKVHGPQTMVDRKNKEKKSKGQKVTRSKNRRQKMEKDEKKWYYNVA